MKKPATTQEKRERIFLVSLLLALCIATFLYVKFRTPPSHPLEMPKDTVYYKGPMKGKGKGGEYGSDTLNPDIPDTSLTNNLNSKR